MGQANALLLYGGGLDSTALLIKYRPLVALHVNYGQVAYVQERRAAQYWCGRYGSFYETLVVDLAKACPAASIVGGKGGDMMDGRNLVLMSVAAMYAVARDIPNVFIGFHQEPPDFPFPDATVQGLMATEEAVGVMLKGKVGMVAPFYDKTRYEIVKEAMATDSKFLKETHTCYTNMFGGCGKCAHCIQKDAFVRQMIAEGL